MILETIQISQNATLTAILHGPSEEMQSDSALRRPAVVICPGGAYEFCSVREADAPASAFLNMGLQVFILLYSCGEDAGGKQPLTEAAQSVRLVRERADEWWIDPQKILICGFSAGGHLAASLGVHWDDPALAERCGVQDASVLRPDAMVLGYPVITAGQYAHRRSIAHVSRASGEPEQYWSLEENVSEKTPPTFLWHTMTDDSRAGGEQPAVRAAAPPLRRRVRMPSVRIRPPRHVGGNARGRRGLPRRPRLGRPLPDLAHRPLRPAGRRCRINCLRRPHLFSRKRKDGGEKSAWRRVWCFLRLNLGGSPMF